MHEVRVTVLRGSGAAIVKAALEVGIGRVTICPAIQAVGPHSEAEIVSVETSTPRAKAFLDRVMSPGTLDRSTSSVSTREIRAIVSSEGDREITYPSVEPTLEVFQDLWQLNHVTPSYVARTLAAALLLAYGMRHDDVISIVVAALFLPFMAQVLGLGFGIWTTDWNLASQAALALAVSIVISIAAGVTVALAFGGPMLFDGFKTPAVSLGISLVIGAAAGLSTADDTGRRYLIGVAAAAQSGVFAVWIGVAAVLGFPDTPTTLARIATLALNVVAIATAACASYGFLGLRCGSASHR